MLELPCSPIDTFCNPEFPEMLILEMALLIVAEDHFQHASLKRQDDIPVGRGDQCCFPLLRSPPVLYAMERRWSRSVLKVLCEAKLFHN
jgi:hypothetical protein